MASTAENIQPTRGELLQLKKRIELAKRGHELLREKRDALITEFFDNLEILRGKRENVDKKLEEAFESLIKAEVTLGGPGVKRAAYASGRDIEISVDSRNIMGVNVPFIETEEELERKSTERGYSLHQTTAKLDEAAEKFESALQAILELAEAEQVVKLLAQEIEKTKRRVNSLEHVLIPRLEENKEYIEMRLEEQEREDKFRLKRVKQKIEREKEAALA
ncbi:ATP synthase subunit D [candidate division MSBL1 archaeon SCGC-AAA259J03]|uniref:A-type ATP synthase subunit D n=3 Tax=candidate division MSBL1 TaxID=215777 RepID=A0A656YVU6_9EURY|nr:ATP synthase subunit D [candidate division MSBL1 archaeon SCGC-AAA259B11]KXA95376.1 ATP synthase subunit D [candidate division MSBL1 archaeon SCGC-AAA259I07]KXA97775.1 ATP synthase subunit D [candidate division MSBL1 archaeon SCGC-AAA259J03]